MGMMGVWLVKPIQLIPINHCHVDCKITGLLEDEILGDLDVSIRRELGRKEISD
jgi:hypothetical protein